MGHNGELKLSWATRDKSNQTESKQTRPIGLGCTVPVNVPFVPVVLSMCALSPTLTLELNRPGTQ